MQFSKFDILVDVQCAVIKHVFFLIHAYNMYIICFLDNVVITVISLTVVNVSKKPKKFIITFSHSISDLTEYWNSIHTFNSMQANGPWLLLNFVVLFNFRKRQSG